MRQSIPPWRALLVFAAALVIIVDGSFALAAPPASRTAFIRVNQVGYTTRRIEARVPDGERRGNGRHVRREVRPRPPCSPAPVGANLGSWSSSLPNVYALDFSSVATAGTYTMAVTGPSPATSPSSASTPAERVRAGARELAQLLPGAARRTELHPVRPSHGSART